MAGFNYFSIILLLFAVTCGNKADKSLDGKSYLLSTWDVNYPDKQDKDVLVFKNGTIDSEACHQYGFKAAAYKSTLENEKVFFSGTISSTAEGTIKIDGIANKTQIEGTMLWKKAGQADIKYGFKGQLKSE